MMFILEDHPSGETHLQYIGMVQEKKLFIDIENTF